ncbi:MAG TPA: hypothetical protein VIT89_11600 [Solirubrobacterales bacterium]
MAVMMPREKWTDERLDDLQAEMRAGFTRVEGEIKRLDSDIKRLDGTINELGREINARFEGLYRTLQAGTVAVIVALIGSNAF